VEKMDKDQIGSWAFLLGILIAIVTAFVTLTWVPVVLVLLGLLVGFLNLGDKQIQSFLIASIAFLVAGTANLSAIPSIGTYLEAMLTNIGHLVAPAVVVVALKAIYDFGKG